MITYITVFLMVYSYTYHIFPVPLRLTPFLFPPSPISVVISYCVWLNGLHYGCLQEHGHLTPLKKTLLVPPATTQSCCEYGHPLVTLSQHLTDHEPLKLALPTAGEWRLFPKLHWWQYQSLGINIVFRSEYDGHAAEEVQWLPHSGLWPPQLWTLKLY